MERNFTHTSSSYKLLGANGKQLPNTNQKVGRVHVGGNGNGGRLCSSSRQL